MNAENLIEFPKSIPVSTVAPAKSLYIAIPAYTGSISIETAHSIVAAVAALTSAGLDIKTDFLAGCCYLDHTRNLLAERFLKSDATDLLFVDADVGFPIEAAIRIALAQRPFVAGIYPKKSRADQEWPVDFTTETLQAEPDGLLEAAHVPTGFLRIHRSVFECLEANGLSPEYQNQTERVRRFFRVEAVDGKYWGEDFRLCEDWGRLGGKIHIIPDIDFDHVGSKTWRGNWGQWVRSPEIQGAPQPQKEAAE